MGKESIDVSLRNVWASWFKFKSGKKYTPAFYEFEYNLEANLCSLHFDLLNGIYKHGEYQNFIVTDNKRRLISVASIRDRVVHRLIYEYLVPIYDHMFIYDLWSCRKGKGLSMALDRLQHFAASSNTKYFWKADVKSYFDNISHDKLEEILKRKIKDSFTLNLVKKVYSSYSVGIKGRGIAIGNLTSQILANIYLHEFDFYIKQTLGIRYYLRYGDDLIIFHENSTVLREITVEAEAFLDSLGLTLRYSLVFKKTFGLKAFGHVIYPFYMCLNSRNKRRILKNLNTKNAGSYLGVLEKNNNLEFQEEVYYALSDKIN